MTLKVSRHVYGKYGRKPSDMTAHTAIRNVEVEDEAESERYYELLDKIDQLCDEAGFEIADKIILKDLKTGKVWR